MKAEEFSQILKDEGIIIGIPGPFKQKIELNDKVLESYTKVKEIAKKYHVAVKIYLVSEQEPVDIKNEYDILLLNK